MPDEQDAGTTAAAEALVAATLAGAGIVPSAKELAILGRQYGRMRLQVDRLYAVDVGDDTLAAHLRAAEVNGFPSSTEGA